MHFAFGYTGNGVGPSHLAGPRLAAPRDRPAATTTARRSSTRRARASIPPEPLRWLGGTAVLAALKRKEAAEERGGHADPVTRAYRGDPGAPGIDAWGA